jgi:hypothetical protein
MIKDQDMNFTVFTFIARGFQRVFGDLRECLEEASVDDEARCGFMDTWIR